MIVVESSDEKVGSFFLVVELVVMLVLVGVVMEMVGWRRLRVVAGDDVGEGEWLVVVHGDGGGAKGESGRRERLRRGFKEGSRGGIVG